MKTFKDLEFKKHSNLNFDTHATMNFCNKYGVSVISGEYAYTNEKYMYEVAILKDGRITYESGITDDVIGYCDEKKVTDIMKKVQELK